MWRWSPCLSSLLSSKSSSLLQSPLLLLPPHSLLLLLPLLPVLLLHLVWEFLKNQLYIFVYFSLVLSIWGL